MRWSWVGDPGGIRTRDLDLERVASWARLDDGVECGAQYTRPRRALETLRRLNDGLQLDEVASLEARRVRHPHRDGAARRLDRQRAVRIDGEDAADDDGLITRNRR